MQTITDVRIDWPSPMYKDGQDHNYILTVKHLEKYTIYCNKI